jgi:all-trans-retinol 13,14-reductase
MQKYDVIIIGSGPGGLSAGLCLAHEGRKVLILEQHYVPGGWCHSFYLNGQRFSPGVHYVGRMEKGQSTANLFEGLGIANDLVFFKQNAGGYDNIMVGNEKIPLAATFEKMYESLAIRFPHEKKRLKRYLNIARKVDKQIDMMPHLKGLDFLILPYKLRHLMVFGFLKLTRVVNMFIKDPLLRDVLCGQWGDHGIPPYKASFLMHCALMGHYDHGGYYPVGGGSGVVKAMTKVIKKHGGEIRVESGVKKILIEGDKTKKAVGVELYNGETIYANQIISNADPNKTYEGMIGKEHLSKKLNKKLDKTVYSFSSLIFFVTLDMDVKKYGIDSGNIWMTENVGIDEQCKRMKDIDLLSDEEFPHMFLSCSTLKDPVSYNGRYHSFEMVALIENNLFDKFKGKENYQTEEYLQYKEKISKKFIKNLEKVLPGAGDHIVQAELGTPKTNEFYVDSSKANVYGTEKNLKQLLFPFGSRSEIENLYLCGASVGTQGLSSACRSGVNAAAMILNTTPDKLLEVKEDQTVRIYDAEHSTEWPAWVFQKIKDKNNHLKLSEKKMLETKDH